jgi:hypothetical protein
MMGIRARPEGVNDAFFQAVRGAAECVLGSHHPCLVVLERAIAEPGIETTRMAHDALEAVGDANADAIILEFRRRQRGDLRL